MVSSGSASMSLASTSTTSDEFAAETPTIFATHSAASSRSRRPAITAIATRRRFSRRARRNMIGIAHSSPSRSGWISWYETTNARSASVSTRPCECEISSIAIE